AEREGGSMSHACLSREIALHERIREQLVRAYGDEIDDETLLDTLAGETNVEEMIAALYRQALADEATRAALEMQIDRLSARRDRFKARIERCKATVLSAMQQTGRDRINAPD